MRPRGRDSHRNQKEGFPPTSHYLRLHRRLLVVLRHRLGVRYLHLLRVGRCLRHQLGHYLRGVRFLVPASVRAAAVDVCVIDMVCAELCVMPVLEKELCVCPLASESSTFIPVTFVMGRIDCLPSW